ncbi:MAG: hypothetical protein P4L80_00720 [Xanthobacteraceae bacterium]|nr:hypothetical protein [Xanthobacteraceae bacterium]
MVTAIGQIDTVLAASETSAPDVHFAAERIQDIARALRQREVEAVLCDTLEAAIHEVGDAILHNNATAARALSAAALLRELAHRVNDMVARAAMAEPGVAGQPAADEMRAKSAAERLHDTAQDPASAAVRSPAEDDVGSPLQLRPLRPTLPDPQAPVGPQEDPDELFELLALPVPSSLEQEAPQASDGNNGAATMQANTESMPPPEGPSPQPRGNANPIPRAALDDLLAALHALSEEELIALFS